MNSDIFKRCIVSVISNKDKEYSHGTGFFISNDGEILTVYHNVQNYENVNIVYEKNQV